MTMPNQSRRRKGQSGNALVELALLAPWIFFLFVGVLDFGFYGFMVICTENAARAAALRTATNSMSQSQAIACIAAMNEMTLVLNMSNFVAGCTSGPLVVTQTTLTNATTPPCADCGVDATATSSQVRVTYTSVQMIPIPGILTGQVTLSRVVEARILVQ